jgi:hypothetical protein
VPAGNVAPADAVAGPAAPLLTGCAVALGDAAGGAGAAPLLAAPPHPPPPLPAELMASLAQRYRPWIVFASKAIAANAQMASMSNATAWVVPLPAMRAPALPVRRRDG